MKNDWIHKENFYRKGDIMPDNELLEKLRAYYFGKLVVYSTFVKQTTLKTKLDNVPENLSILYALYLYDKVEYLAKQNGMFENKEQFRELFDIPGCTKLGQGYWIEKYDSYNKSGLFEEWNKEMEV